MAVKLFKGKIIQYENCTEYDLGPKDSVHFFYLNIIDGMKLETIAK